MTHMTPYRESSALSIAMHAAQLMEVSSALVKSGLIPGVRTPEAAFALIVKGQELGLPPMAALAGITVIQGKEVRPRRAILLNSKCPSGCSDPWSAAPVRRDKMDSSKVCRTCGGSKPFSAFSPNPKRRDGVQSKCKACHNEAMRAARRADPEKARAASRAEYAANTAARKASAKKYADAHREEVRAKANAKRAVSPEEAREAERARYWANPAQYRHTKLSYWHGSSACQEARQIRRANPIVRLKGREAARIWRRANPASVKQATQNRRARELAAPGSFTRSDLESIYAAQNGLCAYCEAPLSGGYTVDHVIPLSRGGSNWPGNLACACAFCNTSKGVKTPEEFAVYREQVKA